MEALISSGWKTKLPFVVVLPPTVTFHWVGTGAADEAVCAYTTDAAVNCVVVAGWKLIARARSPAYQHLSQYAQRLSTHSRCDEGEGEHLDSRRACEDEERTEEPEGEGGEDERLPKSRKTRVRTPRNLLTAKSSAARGRTDFPAALGPPPYLRLRQPPAAGPFPQMDHCDAFCRTCAPDRSACARLLHCDWPVGRMLVLNFGSA